jgi:hypothetical protein
VHEFYVFLSSTPSIPSFLLVSSFRQSVRPSFLSSGLPSFLSLRPPFLSFPFIPCIQHPYPFFRPFDLSPYFPSVCPAALRCSSPFLPSLLR